MKKDQKIQFEFKKLKSHYNNIKQQVSKTKDYNLWHHEAVIRNKIKALKSLPQYSLKGYNQVYEGYVKLLDEVSVRLLSHYNKKNRTDYNFDEIVLEDYLGYLNSGIIIPPIYWLLIFLF